MNLNAQIAARIAAAQAKAKTHTSVITYSDGSVDRVDHASEVQAGNYVARYLPLVGKHEYISRATGLKKTIVSCDVVAL